MFYRLQKYCKLVEGARRGAIYNFQTGKVYSINHDALQFLLECQKNTFENILDLNSPDNKEWVEFLESLTEMGLGAFYINTPPNPDDVAVSEEPLKLKFLWLELTSQCNNKCLHCYSSSDMTTDSDAVTHERWLSLISEARSIGAKNIQFIGGEPLLYPLWRDLVLQAHSDGYESKEIFTNATLIKKEHIEFFQKYKVYIATTIYADNAAIHDEVTQHKGSFKRTLAAIKMLKEANIPLRIASIIMKANENEANNIMHLCEELGVNPGIPDVIRPAGRGNDKDLLPSTYTRESVKPPFYTNYTSFCQSQNYHNCLAGKLAITSSGDVIPCIFARDELCGNILDTKLIDIVNGPLMQKYWRTTKDKVQKCKDCEYRYSCDDCRPLAQAYDENKNWLACSAGCSYNPYTGIWGAKKYVITSKNKQI
mgnify:CR=1 FL=1